MPEAADRRQLQVCACSSGLDGPRDFDAALDAFARRLSVEGRSPKTVSAYLRDLSCLARILTGRYPGVGPGEVTSLMLDEALSSIEVRTAMGGGSRSAASLHRFKAAVKSFFSWAQRSGVTADNPAASLTLHRLPRSLPRFLTEAEKHRLLDVLRNATTEAAARDLVIVELFLGTGVRLQELVALDIDDVDLGARHVRIRAKGGVQQVKFLNSNLCSLLRSYLDRCRLRDGNSRALFLSNRGRRLCQRQVARRLDYWLNVAGIGKRLSPHALRHTFATHLYNRTGDILVVQRALGHRDLSTTLIYTHLVDSQLENALERL